MHMIYHIYMIYLILEISRVCCVKTKKIIVVLKTIFNFLSRFLRLMLFLCVIISTTESWKAILWFWIFAPSLTTGQPGHTAFLV